MIEYFCSDEMNQQTKTILMPVIHFVHLRSISTLRGKQRCTLQRAARTQKSGVKRARNSRAHAQRKNSEHDLLAKIPSGERASWAQSFLTSKSTTHMHYQSRPTLCITTRESSLRIYHSKLLQVLFGNVQSCRKQNKQFFQPASSLLILGGLLSRRRGLTSEAFTRGFCVLTPHATFALASHAKVRSQGRVGHSGQCVRILFD